MPDLTSIAMPLWLVLVLQIVLIVVVAALAIRFSHLFLRGLFRTLLEREAREGASQQLSKVELERRLATLDSLGSSIAGALIVLIAGLMVMGILGIDIGPAIAALGIVGIAVGFGAQSLVRDYFNGVLILIENQYGKGDVVRVANVEGTVEDLTLRRTTLRDYLGNVHTVPNGAITVASNLTRGYAVISEELQIPAADLVEPATDVINTVGRGLAEDPKWAEIVLEPPHVERIEAIGPSGVTLQVRGRVLAGNRHSFSGELRRRLFEAFREHGLPLVPTSAAPAAAELHPDRSPEPHPAPSVAAPSVTAQPAAKAETFGGPEPPPT